MAYLSDRRILGGRFKRRYTAAGRVKRYEPHPLTFLFEDVAEFGGLE